MPKKSKPSKRQPLYRRNPPRPPKGRAGSPLPAAAPRTNDGAHGVTRPTSDLPHAHPITPAHFELREDGSIAPAPFGVHASACSAQSETVGGDTLKRGHQTPPSTLDSRPSTQLPRLVFSSDTPFIRLYHGNSLDLLDAVYAKYGDAGRFDAIFADPPYFLSNGGITCHAGESHFRHSQLALIA